MSFHNHRQLAFLHRWIQNTYFLWGGRIPLNYRQTYCVASALLNHYLQMVRPQALQNICKNQNGISRFNQIKDNFSSRCSVYDLFLLLSLPWCSVPPITLLFFWAAERFRWGWLSLSSPCCPLPGLPYPCPSPAWSALPLSVPCLVIKLTLSILSSIHQIFINRNIYNIFPSHQHEWH